MTITNYLKVAPIFSEIRKKKKNKTEQQKRNQIALLTSQHTPHTIEWPQYAIFRRTGWRTRAVIEEREGKIEEEKKQVLYDTFLAWSCEIVWLLANGNFMAKVPPVLNQLLTRLTSSSLSPLSLSHSNTVNNVRHSNVYNKNSKRKTIWNYPKSAYMWLYF